MFANGFFSRYWRYLFAFICGFAAITTGPSCVTGGRNPGGGGGGGGAPLLIITSIASSNISDVGATVTWRTNRAADSQVEYGVSTTYGNVVSLKTLDTDHQLTLFGLSPDTLYHYRVKSTDGAGNPSTSGDLTFTTTKSTPKIDFALSANPTNVNVTRGLTANSAITITRTGGFADAVALSATGLPSGVTATFSPASTTGGGSALTLAASSTAATGTANVTISGAGGGLTRSTTFVLTVTAPTTPDFTVSANPASLTVNRGANGTSTITINRANFSSSVALGASGLPSGVTASFNPASTTGGSSTLTLAVSNSAALGSATVTVTGTSGNLTRTATINLVVPAPDFAISANPASLAINRAASGTSSISIKQIGGLTGSVTLSASGLPAGVTANFTPPNPAIGTSSALTLAASSTATIGPATITVTGTGGGVTRTTPISFSVVNPQDTLSLAPYTGAFTETEARTLFDRFGFGAPPERIAQAVSEGLETTVTKLTTWQSETTPNDIDSIVFDWGCDGWLKGDSQDNPTACNRSNPYDFHNKIFPNAKLIKFLHSPNQYFYKLILFLHDERMAASNMNEDPWFARHAQYDHWNMLLSAAQSGDFMQFMRSWMKDSLGQVFWLSGELNDKEKPNENFAREFWELGTVGPRDLNGVAVYSDLDIAHAALVHTGYSRSATLNDDGTGEPYQIGVYKEADHAQGRFDIFVGTPYQASVSTQEELLQATFRHPRAAEHLAEDLWKEFLNTTKDPDAIRQLAQIIRDSNFNLTPVMRTIMRSKALYAPGSKETLIKQPIELVIGFLRSFPGYNPTHIHHGDDYTVLTWHTSALGQSFMAPNSVFGWDEKVLAGASYIKTWRDVSNQLITKTVGSYADYFTKYSLRDHFWTGLSTTDQLIDRLSSCFNVPLNSSQRGFLKNYLDTQPRPGASPQSSPFSSAGATQQELRIKGAIAILVNQPSYRTK
jgi:uncharacterized protein DUF1800/purple acid phosphatase-like protein